MTHTRYQFRQSPSVEFLAQRHELLCIMQKSHLRWMDKTEDENIKEIHRTLANSFLTLIKQYDILLNTVRISNSDN